jgi:hypothetical protein
MKTTLILTTLTPLVLGFNSITLAQSEDYPSVDGLLQPNTQGELQKNEIDSTGESTFGSGLDPMQLMHNANFQRSRNGAEFAEDTRNNINNAANEFKKLQQQRILDQTQQ